jgi:hypothetical protein
MRPTFCIAMITLDETRLRRMLQEHITEPYVVTEVLEFEDELDSQGRPIPHREVWLRRYEGRLLRLRQIAPDRVDIHRDQESIIRVLQAISPTERLFHWAAQSSAREYHGMCSMRCVVYCLSHDRNTASATQAEPAAPPNGGPAAGLGNSDVDGGPPSVS